MPEDFDIAWEILADSCRELAKVDGAPSGFLVVYADLQEALAAADPDRPDCWILLPHISIAMERTQTLGSARWLSAKTSPDPLPEGVARGLEALLQRYRQEVIPAAEGACLATKEHLQAEEVGEFISAVARHCASDIPEGMQGWIWAIGFEEAFRLLVKAGCRLTDDEIFTGMMAPREDGESLGLEAYLAELTFTGCDLREDQVEGAWSAYATNHSGSRFLWGRIADCYQAMKKPLHARSVLESMAEGFLHDSLCTPGDDVDLDAVLRKTENEVSGALQKLAEMSMQDKRIEDAYFYWRRLKKHVTAGPGTVSLDPAEIDLHIMECRKSLGFVRSQEELDLTNRVLRENQALRESMKALESRLHSGEVRQRVLQFVREEAVAALKRQLGDPWDRLCGESQTNLTDATCMIRLHREGRDFGFDLKKAVVMQTAWGVEAQLGEAIFTRMVLAELGWSGSRKPTLHDFVLWIERGQLGSKAVRIASNPQRLCEPRYLAFLRELGFQRNRVAHGFTPDQFEAFQRNILESATLADLLSILVDFRHRS